MEKKFMKGNEALAEAAVRAGVRFFAGYPITPQNEVPEYLSRRLPEVGGVFIQGESEIASINMVYGAASTGVSFVPGSSAAPCTYRRCQPWRPRTWKHPARTVRLSPGDQGFRSWRTQTYGICSFYTSGDS